MWRSNAGLRFSIPQTGQAGKPAPTILKGYPIFVVFVA
jgi:hypothetical protein